MRRVSIAWYLLLPYVALLVYASFYPFLQWNWAGIDLAWVMNQPLPRVRWSAADNVLNVLGYIPLGFLLCLGLLRQQQRLQLRGVLACFVAAAVLCSAWSWSVETLQLALPMRVSSKLDWLTNSAGAAAGAALAAALERLNVLGHWQVWRSRWIKPHAATECALLMVWPFALLAPTAVPLGLGQVSERWMLWLAQADWLPDALEPQAEQVLRPLSAAAGVLCVTLGLLVVLWLACLTVQTLFQRLLAVAAMVFAGWAGITVSQVLSFGPSHSWAWWTLGVQAGFVLAVMLALATVWLPSRVLAVLAALALVCGLGVLNQASSSAYFWQTLQTWEQGRFIHFHGVAQWLGWVWPYATLWVLVKRMLTRQNRFLESSHV